MDFREHDGVDDVAALDAERVLVATDGYGRALLPELADAVWPARGQVVVSEPLERVLYDRPHYARQGFDYWQQLPDRTARARRLPRRLHPRRAHRRGGDDADDPGVARALPRRARGGEARISHRWAGIFALTQDMLPLVGEVPGRPGVWIAVGYSGHGNVMGFGCGRMAAGAMLGESHELLALFDPVRVV